MFFFFSKTLFYVLMPITWILAFFIFGLLTKNRRTSRVALYLSLGLLLFFTNSFLLNEAWLLWEKAPVPLKSMQKYDAGILLSGFTSLEKSPHDRVYTNKGADRLLHTVMLYKKGFIRKIIVSGGYASPYEIAISESNEIKSLLLLSGVPETDIMLENKSRNTYENARFTKQLLHQYPDIKKIVLITSAFHMRRATACFNKAGVNHAIFPGDFYSNDRLLRLEAFIPSEMALSEWSKLLHEIVGYLVYKALGYC